MRHEMGYVGSLRGKFSNRLDVVSTDEVDPDLDPHRGPGTEPEADPFRSIVSSMSKSAAKNLAITHRPMAEADDGADFGIDM